jgi:hypothetical protein
MLLAHRGESRLRESVFEKERETGRDVDLPTDHASDPLPPPLGRH